MVLQRTYDINPDLGFPGALARPSEPHSTGSGIIAVGGTGHSSVTPRPGDAIYYDRASGAFRLPNTDANFQDTCAILGYRADQVADADSRVSFVDGDEIQFFTLGTVWVLAGQAMQYGDLLHWDGSGTLSTWAVENALTIGAALTASSATAEDAANLANQLRAYILELRRHPIVCVSRDPVSSGGIAQAQIGYGRVALQ